MPRILLRFLTISLFTTVFLSTASFLNVNLLATNWELVSEILRSSTPSQILSSPKDSLHIVWHAFSDNDIHHIERYRDGTWSRQTNISHDVNTSDKELFAIDSNNGVHAIWHDQSENLFYSWRPDGGNWSTPVNLTTDIAGSVWGGAIAITNDKVHVVWYEWTNTATYTLHYKWRYLTGSWVDTSEISNGLKKGKLLLTADSRNQLHLLWGPVAYDYKGFYWTKPDDGVWSVDEALPEPVSDLGNSTMFVDDNGVVHLFLWQTGGPKIYYSCRELSGSWSTPEQVTDQMTQHFDLRAVQTPQGILHAVWTVNPNIVDHSSWGLYYAQRRSEEGWTVPKKITPFASLSEGTRGIFAQNIGGAYLVFQVKEPSNHESLYSAMVSSEGVWSTPKLISSGPYVNAYVNAVTTATEDDTIHIVAQNYSSGEAKLYYTYFSFEKVYLPIIVK